MMRKFYPVIKAAIFIIALLSALSGYAQNVGINSSGSAPDASAGLDVSFTNKGLLVPRVALTATNAASPITSPTTSLLVYNTATAGTAPNNVVPGYYYWNGSAWTILSTGAATNDWSLTGNSTSNTNFLGTANNQSLRFRTNNLPRLHVDSLGSVAVGYNPSFSATAREKFLVDAGGSSLSPLTASTGFNVINGKGYINNYLQLNIQNRYAGTAASSDVVATADNGDETTNYVDMGINSSANTSAYFGGANDAYLYNIGQNLLIGTGTANKSIAFLTGGGTQSTNERMRISGTGNVGIGNINPTYKLQVNAASDPLYLTGVQAGSNTDSLLTIANGVVKKLAPTVLTNDWSLAGNSTSNTNFIGTINNQSMRFRTNNLQRMYIDSLGSVSIGANPSFSTTAREKFLVDAGGTSLSPLSASTGFNAINAKGYINNYLQLNIQNRYAGTAASSDVVATADNGDENTNYIDMGINSSANTAAYFGGANDAYLYNIGQNLLIGTGTASKSIAFLTGGGTQSTNERMRINGSGNVGIGTNNPSYRLTVAGTNPLYLSGVQTGANTDSIMTITGGIVKKLAPSYLSQWSTSGSNINYNSGNVGIGTSTFDSTNPEKLLINVGTNGSINAIVAKGNNPTYVQMNVQNLSNGTTASSDVVATNDLGTESGNYIDMGINSSGNTSTGTLGGANTAYLYSTGSAADFVIGNLTPSKNLTFFSADGTGTITEKMRLNTLGVTMAQAIKTITATYTITIDDYTVLANNSSNITINLPPAASVPGRCYSIKKISASNGNRTVTVNPFGTELIDNGVTIAISTANVGYIVQSDGIAWWIINR